VIVNVVFDGDIPSLFVEINFVGSKELSEIVLLPCKFNAIFEGSVKPVESSSSDPNPNCK
jgi:hypothetical protein